MMDGCRLIDDDWLHVCCRIKNGKSLAWIVLKSEDEATFSSVKKKAQMCYDKNEILQNTRYLRDFWLKMYYMLVCLMSQQNMAIQKLESKFNSIGHPKPVYSKH